MTIWPRTYNPFIDAISTDENPHTHQGLRDRHVEVKQSVVEPLLFVDGDAVYLRRLAIGGSHLVSARWLCDFAIRIENTLRK